MSRKNNNFTARTLYNETKPVIDEQASNFIDNKKTISSLGKNKKKNRRFQVVDNFIQPEEAKQEFAFDELSPEPLKKTQIMEKKREQNGKLLDILFVIGTIYFCFLTFGVWTTTYHYNQEGEISAQAMTYEDIVQKKSFEVLMNQYIECRDLYEKVLNIDKKLAEGRVQPFTLAPLYEGIVTEAETLYTKTEALSIDVQYEQIRTMYLTWLKEDIASYCKNMSTAISQNNEKTAEIALTNRKSTYNDFSLITQNIIAMGETIPGIDLVNIRKWDAANIYTN